MSTLGQESQIHESEKWLSSDTVKGVPWGGIGNGEAYSRERHGSRGGAGDRSREGLMQPFEDASEE